MTETPNPFSGLPDALTPHPQAPMPEPPSAGDAMSNASPFKEALDIDEINRNLVLDRPLKLYIPNKEKYPQFEFRIINSIPQEIAAARNKGFREVTDDEVVGLFSSLVAGTDKDGKAFRPILMARPKSIGETIRERIRKQLASLYAGMNPANKDLTGKYTMNVEAKDGTKGSFTGAGFRIRTK